MTTAVVGLGNASSARLGDTHENTLSASRARSMCTTELAIHADSSNYGVVEDLHQAIMHASARYIRRSRMSADAISTTVF